MNDRLLATLALAASSMMAPHAGAQQPGAATSQVVAAAETFLASLTPDQRSRVLYPFDDAAQRARWSNFPTGVVPRGGISLQQMSAAQRDAAMALLGTVLSPAGLEKINLIRQADDDFKANGSKRGPPGARGGPRPASGSPGIGPGANGPFGGRPPPSSEQLFGSGLYYISLLGKPSSAEPWMLQFGGHHLALNITIAKQRGVLTPTLTGAQPARFVFEGHVIRPLGRESDKALALLRSLDASQRRRAVLRYAVPDLVLGPGQDGKTIAPEGLEAAGMSEAQRAKLVDLIAEWAGIVNTSAATTKMNQVKADLDRTWFAWSGPTTARPGSNITAYYRIQGPHLVIEYSPQQDEPDNHVHTIYRDPADDYGRASIKP